MWGKVTNDAAAFIRSIAQKRGRNAAWAEMSVRQSVSATETEALRDSVINFVCPSVDSLLKAVNGLVVETSKGSTRIETANADIIYLDMNWRSELLSIISDPNIAYILMMIGIYGILFEIFNPGAIFPGVAGGIALILAFYSLRMLPVNYAGLALILLAVVLFLLEIKVTSYGALTIGGIISLFFGSLMLIQSPVEFMNISLTLIITTVIVTALFFTFVVTLGIKAQYRKKTSGVDGLIGETGVVISDITTETAGRVRVHGEIWRAASDVNVPSGGKVIIEEVKDLTIKVKPLI
jgi:membrane-bound serine protease (ClpP class)